VVDSKASKDARGYQHFRKWMCALAEESLPSHHPKGSHLQGESHHQAAGHTAYMHVWTTVPTGSRGESKSNTPLDRLVVN